MSATVGIASSVPSIGSSAAARSAATRSMAELGVASLIGAGCVERDLVDPSMIQALSKATFSILLPMFLCTSIISSVTKYGLSRSSLAVPLLAIVQCFILYVFTTQCTLPLLGIDGQSDDGRATTVSCSFGNSGVVPLIFCESLFRDGKNADFVAQSTAFVSLWLIGWSPFFWGFGRSVLISNRDDTGKAMRGSGTNGTKHMTELCWAVKRALPPPVVGTFVGLLVATTPLCKLFVSFTGEGNRKVPLAVIFNCAANFGRAASPLSLLILVSSLAVGAGIGQHKKSVDESEDSAKQNEIKFLTKWALVSITRFLVSPALMYGLLTLAAKIGCIGDATGNPMLWFVLILESAMPPAQNTVTMLQVADKRKAAGDLAMFLFSVYATSMIPVVLVLTWALQTFKLA